MMHGIKLFTGITLVASLVLEASGLVMNPISNHDLHRRHAAAVVNLVGRGSDVTPVPLPLKPKRAIAERRALRQKRCFQRLSDSATTTTTGSGSAPTDVPANVAPGPAQDETTTTTVQQQQQGQGQTQPQPQPPQNNSGADTFSGQLTFYDVGLGACGRTNSNNDMIAAASMLLYDGFDGYTGGNPNNNPICGKRAAVTYEGKTIEVEIVDRCVGCAKYDLDLSPTAFSLLADQGLGRLNGMTWHFI